MAAAAFVIAVGAQAAPAWAVSCPAGIANDVTPNSGCEIGSTNNDSPGQVNTDNLFGDSWTNIARDNDLDGTDQGPEFGALTIDDGQFSGDWSIDLSGTGFTEALLVFKGGNGVNIAPQNYVGYLLSAALIGADGLLNGTYASPFTNTLSGNPARISHVTLYARTSVIPLPASLLLLLSGLGGLGLLGWRRQAVAA